MLTDYKSFMYVFGDEYLTRGHVSFSLLPYTSVCSMRKKIFEKLHAFITIIVFTMLDFLDSILCIIYAYLDDFIEGTSSPCYCHKRGHGYETGVSETLYERRNVFRENGFLNFKRKSKGAKRKAGSFGSSRWSDCGCKSCVSWMKSGNDIRLHVAVQEPGCSSEIIKDMEERMTENVLFLHGFISSSYLWTETVFRSLSDDTKNKYRLFAVDLLGLGKSPKPRDCLYTLDNHVEMIEKSVIFPFRLNSFHLVAHSMGSVIALALAAKYPQSLKSVTLIAPPYFPASKEEASLATLRKLAEKSLWPPLHFGVSFMSWYEHLGRTVCFIICKYHRIWEFFFKVATFRRELHFLITDLTKHTHHSAWHTVHNVIYGGAKRLDECLEIMSQNSVKLTVIQGEEDQVVPLECSFNIKMKACGTDVRILPKRDHITVLLPQAKELTQTLESIWKSCN